MILEVILFILLVILGIIVFNLLRQIEKLDAQQESLQDAIIQRDTIIDDYEKFIQTFSDNLTLIDTQLKRIDSSQMFQSDDEVGYLFNTIKIVMSKLQEFNVNAINSGSSSSETKKEE